MLVSIFAICNTLDGGETVSGNDPGPTTGSGPGVYGLRGVFLGGADPSVRFACAG